MMYHIPQEDLEAHIKTKLRNTCERYSNIKIPYKYRKIVEISKTSRIVRKCDKGRDVVLMDTTVYLEKCLDMLDTNKFTRLSKDQAMKRRKNATKFTKNEK